MPSFFYAGYHPTLVEYYQHRWSYDLRFLFPYCIASVVLTFVCLFVAPKLSKRITRSHNIAVPSTASLVLVFMAAGVSDVVNLVWLNMEVFYGETVDCFIRLLIVGLPIAIISALFAAAVEKRPSATG